MSFQNDTSANDDLVVKENDKIVDDGKDWREEQIYLGSPQSGLSGNL